MKQMQTCISLKKIVLILIYCFILIVWWPNFRATFPLISPKVFGIIHTKLHHKSQKNMPKLLVPNSQWVWKQYGMMLWIMSGTFNTPCIVLSCSSPANENYMPIRVHGKCEICLRTSSLEVGKVFHKTTYFGIVLSRLNVFS